MKIKKIFIPTIGLVGLTSAAMPMVLSSCNDAGVVAVPVEKMKFIDDAQFGRAFNGFVEGTDLSKYNTLVLPDDVDWTKKNCFGDLTKENNSNIKTIVFNKNLTKMGGNSFVGDNPVTVTKLDFSKCEYIHEVDEGDFSNKTFNGLSHEHLGTIVSNINKMPHDDFLTLCLRKGLPGEWLLPTEWTTTHWVHTPTHLWKPRFQPLQFDAPKSSEQAIEAYAEAVKNVPSIFIDDFLNAYSNYIPLDPDIISLEETVSNVSVSNKDGNILGSFDLTFVANKQEEGKTAYSIGVEYRNIPLTMVTPSIFEQDESTCALVFDKTKINEETWLEGTSITFGGKVDDKAINTETVDSTQSFTTFISTHSQDNLFYILYYYVEIASGYFRNLEIYND